MKLLLMIYMLKYLGGKCMDVCNYLEMHQKNKMPCKRATETEKQICNKANRVQCYLPNPGVK